MNNPQCVITISNRQVTVQWNVDAVVETDQKPDWTEENFAAFRRAFRECEGGLLHSANVAVENRAISVLQSSGLRVCRQQTGMIVRYTTMLEI